MDYSETPQITQILLTVVVWIYLPPEHRIPAKYHYGLAQHIRQSLDYILSKHPNSGIVLTGDFNQFPDRLITSSFSGLKQCVKFPTREKATLDKFYTNVPMLLPSSMIQLPKVGSSDHFSVLAKPALPSNFTSGGKICVKTRVMEHNHKAMFVQT